MKNKLFNSILFFSLIISLIFFSCTSSQKYKPNKEEESENYENIGQIGAIFKIAEKEQNNPMYSKESDSTYLYWLDNKLILLNNATKCNIYALNTLFKAGFKCPETYVLTYDLMDTLKYNDIFPFIASVESDKLERGDLIIWYGHMIIFDSLIMIKDDKFAFAFWAGTKQKDNGLNVKNNVIYGKYPLQGFYIIRRPQKRE